MQLPKFIFKYLGNNEDAPLGEYSDNGAMKGKFGIDSIITINFSKLNSNIIKKNIDLFRVLVHELLHYFTRPLPRWLEKLLDISLDTTFGNHAYEEVYNIFKIFNKE
jgi:hypothetical protein